MGNKYITKMRALKRVEDMLYRNGAQYFGEIIHAARKEAMKMKVKADRLKSENRHLKSLIRVMEDKGSNNAGTQTSND